MKKDEKKIMQANLKATDKLAKFIVKNNRRLAWEITVRILRANNRVMVDKDEASQALSLLYAAQDKQNEH